MTPERWQEIDRIFAQALELEPSSRAAYLEAACAGDADLRRQVESLLTHDTDESLVGPPSLEEATVLLSRSLTDPAPRFIGRYKIERSLGIGGMGQVFLARDEQLNRPVGVKLLLAYDAAAPERVKRFRREALAASALNHPNILTIYEIGEADGHNFIATEFVDGQTLQELISKGSVSVAQATDIAIQITSALGAAHAAGIVHRDIKPANIMVRADGLVKVLDFGVAKYNESSPSKQSQIETAAGTVIGTAAYMSPEQARGLPLDARTDLWSAGAILYELVTGVRPFQGATALDTMAAIIERPATPFSAHAIQAPAALERIVFKALQKQREDRYASAGAFLADLKQLARSLETEELQAGDVATRSLPPKRDVIAIAVMPFTNMSADPENEYFCDGLSEELLNALARVENLKVAARTSAFSFKGKSATASGIARALNVTSILEGSVRKSGNRLRITVQLINAADGYHVWSERYDRELQDIFDVQDEIALSVVNALKVTLLKGEKDAVLKRYTENVEAYQLYLKGRYYWWKSTPQDFHKSREFFQRAVEADPNYALGYCGLSSYYGFGSAWGFVPPDIGWPKAIEANRRAMELDDTLAEVHNDLAGISMVCYRDATATEREARRAIELNPKFQEIHYLYSNYLLIKGQFDAGIGEAQEAVELDPLSVRVNHNLGYCYYLARRFDESIRQFRLALELDEHNPAVHEALGDALEQKGLFDEAIAEWQKALALVGDSQGAELLGSSYAKDGFEIALRTLAATKLGQITAGAGEYVPAIKFVRLYVRLGETDQAFIWLEKACEERNVFPLLFHADPFYDNLRSDPRFGDLLRRFELAGAENKTVAAAVREETSAPDPISTSPDDSQLRATKDHRAQTASDKPGKHRYLLLGGLALVLLIVIGLAYWVYTNRRPQISSIAVMPFVNDSGNTEVEYLSDGMTDMLITNLSQLPQLSVKARSSVFRYKNKDASPQQVGKELNVQAVLNGRVTQHGNDLTLHIELVDVKTETALWSGDYDRSMTNLATLQGELARDVSRRLRARLSGAEEQKVARNYTDNADAYQLYLKGRYHVFKLTPPEIQSAISYFQQAIDMDPNYALAYVGLASAYRALSLSTDKPSTEVFPKAKAAAQKAIEIDETLAEGHAVLGFTIFWYDWDWNAAEDQYKRALQLNPNSADSHWAYAHLLSNTGRHTEALAEIKRARELDPLSIIINGSEGLYLLQAGEIDEALATFQKTLELDPNFWFAHVFASSAYIEKGMYSEGIAEARKAQELSASSQPTAFLACALAKSGKQAEAWGLLEELLKLSTERYVPPYHIALVYNALGAREQTLVFLERGYSERDPKMVFLKVEPKWNNLRSDPRFQDLMRRVGFAS